MRTAARRKLVVVALGLLAAQAGCTFLISFDDQPVSQALSGDGGPPARETGTTDPDADVVPTKEDGEAPDVMTSADAGLDVYSLDSCAVQFDGGQFCGNNLQRDASYPYRDDLIVCVQGKIASVKSCSRGSGCIHFPNPHPDECDPCQDLPNKLYCGREIPGWRLENAASQIQCMNGAFVRLRQCTTCTNGQQTLCQ